jgi:hypothetical protein
MDCARFHEELWDVLEGGEPGAEFHTHRMLCAACRSHVEETEALDRLLRSQVREPVPAGVWEGVRQGLEPARPVAPVVLRIPRLARFAAVFLLAAVGLAVLSWPREKPRHTIVLVEAEDAVPDELDLYREIVGLDLEGAGRNGGSGR